MARTAPAPNIPAIPGMNPGAWVMGGGGDGGGKGGKGKKGGGGKEGDGTEDGDGDASSDDENGGCAEGDPICPITGRMFVDYFDFGFPGPKPLRWLRSYSSRDSDRAGDLGHGWSHPFSWQARHERRRTRVFDDKGRVQLFGVLDTPGQVRKHPLGWRLEHAGDSLILRLPDPDRVYHFGALGKDGIRHLTKMSDRNGNAIHLHRDDKGVLTALTDSAGRPYRVATDAKGRITSIDVALNPEKSNWLRVVSYAYDANGDMVAATDAEGYTDSYAYTNHLMTEHRTPTGLVYYYRYDGKSADAYCVESWGAYPGQRDPALDDDEVPPIKTAERRSVRGINWVRLTYDKQNLYCEAENSRGGLTRYFGDLTGRAVKIIDAEGNVEERMFDPDTGVLTAESSRTGAVFESEPDSAGATDYNSRQGELGVARWRDENGTEVTFNELTQQIVRRRYDERGNMIHLEHQDGTWQDYAYDQRGLLTEEVQRNGGRTLYEYDQYGNCTRIVHSTGYTELSEYDYLGRRTSHSDSAGSTTEWRWDRRNEIVYKRSNDGSEYFVDYDPIRKPLRYTAAGRTTYFAYGGVGWLCTVTHPGGEVYELRYDTEGDLKRVTNPRGQSFSFRRNLIGRCVGWTTFEGVEYAQQHHPSGEVAWIQSPVARTVVEVSDEGVPVGLEVGEDTVQFEYSSVGLLKLTNGVADVDRDLDVFQRVLRERQGEHELTLAWLNGELAAIACDVGLPVQYERGADACVTAIEVGSNRCLPPAAAGRDWIEFLGDQIARRTSFDVGGLMLRQSLTRANPYADKSTIGTQSDPNVFFSVQYEWDSNRSLVAEHRSDGTRVEYELTRSDQVAVKRVQSGGQLLSEENLSYDRAGSPIVTGGKYDALMRPIGLNNERFEYDAVGRVVERHTDAGVWHYEWNGLDQLVKVKAPHHDVEMDYDARGRRIRKRVLREGEIVKQLSYVWANDIILHEVDELSGTTRTYVQDNDSWHPLGHVDVVGGAERPCYYVLRPEGGIALAVDAAGQTVWQGELSVFGACEPSVSRVDVTIRYANQHYDADVELIYNRHRWYEPRLGMYLSTDPAFLDGTVNPRDYAPNPLKYIDPLGLTHSAVGPPPGSPPGTATPVITNNAAGAPALSQPGPWAGPAGGSTPGFANCPPGALHQGSGFGSPNNPNSAQAVVDRAGGAHGCHSCGAKNSGYKKYKDSKGKWQQHWTCDHQPPRSTYNNKTTAAGKTKTKAAALLKKPGAVRLYPHCKKCSRAQGQALSAQASSGGRATMAATGVAQMQANLGIPG